MESQKPPLEAKDIFAPENFEAQWSPFLSDEDYHADKTAIGSSSLALYLKSPKAFYEGHFKGKQTAETNDMRLGTIIHCALLEPEKFESKCIVMPEFWGYTQKGERTNNANCKEVRDQKAEWLANVAPGQMVVSQEEKDMIHGMVESVKNHPQGPGVFTHGITEQAGYYRDPNTGLRCKIKPDFRANDLYMITDFKTVASSEKKLFGTKAFGPYRYDLRLWMYAYGTSLIEKKPMPNHLFFMAVEKTWPYEAAVFYMTDEQKNQAEYDYHKTMAKLVNSMMVNDWPQRQSKMEPLWTPKFFIDNDVEAHEQELDDAEM